MLLWCAMTKPEILRSWGDLRLTRPLGLSGCLATLSLIDQSGPGMWRFWPITLQECGHPVGLSRWCHQSPPRNHSQCQISPTFHIRKLYTQPRHRLSCCWHSFITRAAKNDQFIQQRANQRQLLCLVFRLFPLWKPVYANFECYHSATSCSGLGDMQTRTN